MKPLFVLVASGTALLGLAAGCEGGSGQVDTASAFSELKRAVAGCADARTSCYASAAGNVTGQAACDTTYDACSASAGKGAEAKLADAAEQCTQQARACRAQATDKQTCKDALKVCVGDDTDDDVDEDADGGDDEDSDPDESVGDGGKGSSGGGGGGSNQHSACKSELTTCLDQGGAPKDCAASVRTCVAAAGKGEHGKPAGDAGVTQGGQGHGRGGQGQGGGRPDAGI